MRRKPYACGGCHLRNYVGDAKFPTILVSDIASSHSVPMPGKTALLLRAVEHAPLWSALAPMPTFGAGLGRMPFLLQGHDHSQSFCLVGKQVPDTAIGPLMDFLVVGGAHIVVLPNIPNIANDHGLHAILIQRGNEP